jgi:hypothetical protein
MATDFDPFKDMPWMKDPENVPVPTVEAADLKIFWKTQQGIQREHPGEQIATDFRGLLKECSPNVNGFAIWYRLSMLGMLSTLCVKSGMPMEKLPWMRSGEPDEFILKALATVPMSGAPDAAMEELTRLVQKEYGT